MTADRLISVNVFHLGRLETCGRIVLGGVVPSVLFHAMVEDVLRQSNYLRKSLLPCRVAQALQRTTETLQCESAPRFPAGGSMKMSLASRGWPSSASLAKAGPTKKKIERVKIRESFYLQDLIPRLQRRCSKTTSVRRWRRACKNIE